ncbi:MAG: LysM peptidoglycan-binding domain-containing protein [Gammaproteobacteria bacterium]|nr:LysM peptidoglycan-binding domain-containing protein [Gammaproteobacteria bacterium]
MSSIRLVLTALSIQLTVGCAALDTASRSTTSPADEQHAVITDLSTHAPPSSGGLPGNGTASAATEDGDFWGALRQGFRLTGQEHAAVVSRAADYGRNPRQVERIFKRGKPYLAYIYEEVKKRNFPTEIVLLPFIESGYDPFAYSHGRAAGLWQFIPGTGKMYGLKQDWWYDGRRDIVASTQAALNYLDYLQQRFDGDWLLAIAAYNSGSGHVSKAIKRNRKAGKPTDFWHLQLPKETSAYVPKLLAISAVVRQPSNYDVVLAPIDPAPTFTVVDTRGQLDIAIAAELATIDTEALYLLNPGFNRWSTHPDGPHQLAIPVAQSAIFEENLAALPVDQRAKWVRHKVLKGETLSHIARRYNTTVSVLRNTNVLKSSTIRIGQHLLVPVAAQDASRYAALAKHLQPARSSSNKVTHKVHQGDNLWKIARQYDVTVNQVTRWNRLDGGALIKPGQQLVIWKNGKASANGKHVRTVNYTVRAGDSLYRIARKFNVTISNLRRWNDLAKGKHLQPGQHLKLYVDVTRLQTVKVDATPSVNPGRTASSIFQNLHHS